MSSSKPAIVLVHGAWMLPSAWDPITGPLTSHGYLVVRPKLPSTGGDPVVPDMSEDTAVIRKTVADLLDRDLNVLVVLHSYAGMPGGNALEGFDAASRAAAGRHSHVVRLVYLSAYLVVEGTQLNPRGTRDNMVPEMIADFEKGVVRADPEGSRRMLFQDVSDAQLAELKGKLVPQSIGVYWDTTTFAAWRYIPTTYVHTLKDLPSTVAIQHYLVDTARASGRCAVDKQIERDVGHCTFITQPDWTVEMIRTEAGEQL